MPKLFLSFLVVFAVIAAAFYFWPGSEPSHLTDLGSRMVEIELSSGNRESEILPPHPLTGKRCAASRQRPYAVMLAEDREARPLSGISRADMVIEMPVVKNSVTRMAAFFACDIPDDMGSVRSARHDFVDLAEAFDAIFVHWGGSKEALDEVARRNTDNIDALINPASTFYRKSGIPAPHNGFTSAERLIAGAKFLGHSLETDFVGYRRLPAAAATEENIAKTISVAYPHPYGVNYIYDTETNRYLRWRGGTPELDAIDGQQVQAAVLVVLYTNSRVLHDWYNDVDVAGIGDALIFQNGSMLRAKWHKSESEADNRLLFYDESGREAPFVAGNIWMHYVDYGTPVKWGKEEI